MWGFPCDSVGKESAFNERDPSSFPGLGRSSGEGEGYPLQYGLYSQSMESQRVVHNWATFTFFQIHMYIIIKVYILPYEGKDYVLYYYLPKHTGNVP